MAAGAGKLAIEAAQNGGKVNKEDIAKTLLAGTKFGDAAAMATDAVKATKNGEGFNMNKKDMLLMALNSNKKTRFLGQVI